MDLRLTKKLFSIHQKILRVKVNTSSILTSDQKNQNAFASKQLLLVQGAMMPHKWSLLVLSELILQHLKVQWSNLPRIATDAFRYLQDQQSAILLGRRFEHSKMQSFTLHFWKPWKVAETVSESWRISDSQSLNFYHLVGKKIWFWILNSHRMFLATMFGILLNLLKI